MSAAEFQKIHDEMCALRKAGKEEEVLKRCTEDCHFMSPLKATYNVKEAIELAKCPKIREFNAAECKVTVDEAKVNGDFAGDRGHFVVKKDGEKTGSYLAIWNKVGGEWKINAMCFNFTMEM